MEQLQPFSLEDTSQEEVSLCSEEKTKESYKEILQCQVLGLKTNTADQTNCMMDKSPFDISPARGFDENEMPTVNRTRSISKSPFKVLDAPALQDDFYLDLVDWSANDTLAVGLGNTVYLWSAQSCQVCKLYEFTYPDFVTSLNWSKDGNYLGVGSNKGIVQVWDYPKMKLIKTAKEHENRIGALNWSNTMLSSGSRDKCIHHYDTRNKSLCVCKAYAHKQEVCGLKWSMDSQMLASGGNDNRVFLWDARNMCTPVSKYTEHKAAVRALDWSPHQHGLLASGGGTADRCIRFWDTLNSKEIKCIQTDSQICNLKFSTTVNELVSTHGYSKNQISIWKYPSMKKVRTLMGHSYRVLYLSMSPDGETIVTGSGDETLRFWRVFPSKKKNSSDNWHVLPSGFDVR
jgi:cell division cycle 20-like protein 1 (cofactor of APC complex)